MKGNLSFTSSKLADRPVLIKCEIFLNHLRMSQGNTFDFALV